MSLEEDISGGSSGNDARIRHWSRCINRLGETQRKIHGLTRGINEQTTVHMNVAQSSRLDLAFLGSVPWSCERASKQPDRVLPYLRVSHYRSIGEIGRGRA